MKNFLIKTARYCFLAFILVSSLATQAQTESNVYGDYVPEVIRTKKMIFSAAAHGDMEWSTDIVLYPGANFDAAFRIWYNEKYKRSKVPGKDSKSIERDLFLKGYIGFHNRPHFHTAVFTGPEIAFRLTSASGIYGEVAFGVGYMHTIYNDPVYELQDDGTFKKVKAGEPHVILGGNLTAGIDFSKISGAPLALFAGLGLNQSYPNNTQWTKYPYVRMGVSYVMRKEKAKK